MASDMDGGSTRHVTLFAGPSAHGLPHSLRAADGVRWRGPVRRGDVDALLAAQSAPAVIVLCDGVFQSEPAVSHAEICRALDTGWQVWGVSSIGAIRAFEMRGEGMLGFGRVHAMFSEHEDLCDDELCLLHLPEPFYEPITEALINLRHAFEQQGSSLGIERAAAERCLARLRALWFGDRSLQRMQAVLQSDAGVAPPAAAQLLDWMQAHRIKTLDLASLLVERPWRT